MVCTWIIEESSAVQQRDKSEIFMYYIHTECDCLSHCFCHFHFFSFSQILRKESTMSGREREGSEIYMVKVTCDVWHMTADAPQPASQNHDAISMRAETNSLPFTVHSLHFPERFSDTRNHKQSNISEFNEAYDVKTSLLRVHLKILSIHAHFKPPGIRFPKSSSRGSSTSLSLSSAEFTNWCFFSLSPPNSSNS